MKIRVVLADDHQLLREGIRSILSKEPDVEVVGEAENGRQALDLVEKTKPNVVIMDISMPNLNGIEATRKIKESHPEAKIIALSMHQDKRFIASMLEAGASGFLLKDCATEELIKSIHTVMQNKTYLSPLISDIVVGDYVTKLKTQTDSPVEKLSDREREVLQLLAEGKSTKEIADILFVSVKTIETHRQQIMNKLDIHNIAELTKLAIREGLTSID